MMNQFFDALRHLVSVLSKRHGERILQWLLWSYFAGYLIPFLLAYFVGQPKLTLGFSILPLAVLIVFLIGRGYAGFVALFSTTEVGQRVFKALLVAIAAQIFTGLVVSLVPIRENRFAGTVAATAIIIVVLLHFGNDKDGFGRFASKWSKIVAVAAVTIILSLGAWSWVKERLPRTASMITTKFAGTDAAIARILGDDIPQSKSWVVETSDQWTEVSLPRLSRFDWTTSGPIELRLLDGRVFQDQPGVKTELPDPIPGFSIFIRSTKSGETASVVFSATPK